MFYRVGFEYNTLLWSLEQERTIKKKKSSYSDYDVSQVFMEGLPFHNRHLVNAHTVNEYVNSYLESMS